MLVHVKVFKEEIVTMLNDASRVVRAHIRIIVALKNYYTVSDLKLLSLRKTCMRDERTNTFSVSHC